MIRNKAHPRVRIAGRALQPTGAERKAPNGMEYDHRFVASTELLASDGGVIPVDAWQVAGWRKRPRWIANHDVGGFGGKLTEISLGRGMWAGVESGLPTAQVGKSGRALVAYVKYASTPFAQEVRTLYEEGGLDDVSVRWDWRSEQLRSPTDEERAEHGDGLLWVAVRTDLVELSAVLLGADAGAQMVRQGVIAAFEQCCSRGIRLPEIERLCRARRVSVPVGASFTREPPELSAAADTVDALTGASTALVGWLAGVGPIRQQIGDALVAMQNLVGAAATDASEGEDEEDEATVALNVLSEALVTFDVALRDVRPAVGEVGDAVKRLAEAVGVVPAVGFVLDLDAVLRDVKRRREPAGSRGPERWVVGGKEVEIDLDAVLVDAARQRKTAAHTERVVVGDKEYVLDIAAIRRDLRRR